MQYKVSYNAFQKAVYIQKYSTPLKPNYTVLGLFENDEFYSDNSDTFYKEAQRLLNENGITDMANIRLLTDEEVVKPYKVAPALAVFDRDDNFVGLRGRKGDVVSWAGEVKATAIGKQRLYQNGGHTGTDPYTFTLGMKAPAQFDAVQINLINNQNSASNTFKVSVAPTAKLGNKWQPVSAEDSLIPFTPITWGTTDPTNPRNPGGGAATAKITNGTASIVGNVQSDWVRVASLPRADVPSDPGALYYVRIYGMGLGATTINGPLSANPPSRAEAEFSSGFWDPQDYTASVPNRAPDAVTWAPSFEIKFLFRGRVVKSIACASDSIEEGGSKVDVVPQWGGGINGWPRKAVKAMTDSGKAVTYTNLACPGEPSAWFHEVAISSILSGGITHMLIKPWSINDVEVTPLENVSTALARTSQIIQMCNDRGIRPILLAPFGGALMTHPARIATNEYIAKAKESGVDVFDPSKIMCGADGGVLAQFLPVNASGEIVDFVHLNEAGHDAMAQYFVSQAGQFGI